MTVTRLWTGGRTLEVTGEGYVPRGEVLENGAPADLKRDAALRRLLQVAALCNNARLVRAGEDGQQRRAGRQAERRGRMDHAGRSDGRRAHRAGGQAGRHGVVAGRLCTAGAGISFRFGAQADVRARSSTKAAGSSAVRRARPICCWSSAPMCCGTAMSCRSPPAARQRRPPTRRWPDRRLRVLGLAYRDVSQYGCLRDSEQMRKRL